MIPLINTCLSKLGKMGEMAVEGEAGASGLTVTAMGKTGFLQGTGVGTGTAVDTVTETAATTKD